MLTLLPLTGESITPYLDTLTHLRIEVFREYPYLYGQGLGVRFFKERERHARQLQRFDTLAFCAVVPPESHALQAKDYRPLDEFWHNRGFAPTDMYCFISWRDLDEEVEAPKPLQFWLKTLES